MTFDDGILRVCEITNVAENGDLPREGLQETASFYFGYDVLGINRYYTALNAKVNLSHVVNIPGWNEFDPRSIVVMEDGRQYRISMAQPMTDENGLRITKLSLERITNEFSDEN